MEQTYYTVTKQNPPFAMNKCKNFSIFTAAILFEKVKTLHRIPLIFFFNSPVSFSLLLSFRNNQYREVLCIILVCVFTLLQTHFSLYR